MAPLAHGLRVDTGPLAALLTVPAAADAAPAATEMDHPIHPGGKEVSHPDVAGGRKVSHSLDRTTRAYFFAFLRRRQKEYYPFPPSRREGEAAG